MKPTSRLYQCALCQTLSAICSHCDRGQIYCSAYCSTQARTQSLKAARARLSIHL